jgi:hypothetical protein
MKKIIIFMILVWITFELTKSEIKTFLNKNLIWVKIGISIVVILVLLFLPSKYLSKENISNFFNVFKEFSSINKFGAEKKRRLNGYTKKIIASQQEWKCGHCNKVLEASYEVDHIKPLSEGGSESEDNLVALCRTCHGEKTFRERSN